MEEGRSIILIPSCFKKPGRYSSLQRSLESTYRFGVSNPALCLIAISNAPLVEGHRAATLSDITAFLKAHCREFKDNTPLKSSLITRQKRFVRIYRNQEGNVASVPPGVRMTSSSAR
uniref:SEFIR domain-containing protein n=1 Tax=Steinernema glaseri TaxID=37863 RepID=A0A1I7ZTF2_9BILA